MVGVTFATSLPPARTPDPMLAPAIDEVRRQLGVVVFAEERA